MIYFHVVYIVRYDPHVNARVVSALEMTRVEKERFLKMKSVD